MQEEHEKKLLALKVNQQKKIQVYCGYGKFWQQSVSNDKIYLLREKEDVLDQEDKFCVRHLFLEH